MFCILDSAFRGRSVWVCLLGVFAVAHASAAPSVTYSVQPSSPKSGIPFRVVYEVAWQGSADEFAVVPLDPAPVAWGTARLARAASGSTEDGQRITLEVEFVAKRPGTVRVPEYRLAYVPGTEAYPAVVEHTPATTTAGVAAGPGSAGEPDVGREPERASIEAPPIDVHVGYYIGPGLIAGLSAAALALSAAGVAVAIRVRRARARHENPIPGAATVQSVINLARQHRLDGKFYDYYRALAHAATLAAPSVAARKLRERLEQDAQRVGYGALQPNDDELEGALRELERVLREPSAPRD